MSFTMNSAGTIPAYQIYTAKEFLSAKFPPPNLDDDKFSAGGEPDLAVCAPRGAATEKFLMVTLESTARLAQNEIATRGDIVEVIGVARKGSLTCQDLENIIEFSGADGFMIDLNTLRAEELAEAREEFKRAGIAT